jgi:hypothetical protein
LSRYLDFHIIGIIDLDATKLPGNDREILEAVTKRMFTDPSIMDAIASGRRRRVRMGTPVVQRPSSCRKRQRGFSESL